MVENTTTDPYTGGKDDANYAGKKPVAVDQSVVGRTTKGAKNN